MATQTALALTEINAPLTKIQLPIPEPKDHEILIKMAATAIAPLDQKLRDLNLFNISSRLPAILTHDLSGTVVSHSPTLPSSLKAKFPIGTRVFSQALMTNPRGGGLQEYTLVDARYTAIVPDGIGELGIVMFPINGFTAFAALFSDEGGEGGECKGLGIRFPVNGKEGEDYGKKSIVILGGGARCGKLAIQFSKLVGIGKIITTASMSSENELESLGATHVFDRKLGEGVLIKGIRDVLGSSDGECLGVFDTMSFGERGLAVGILGEEAGNGGNGGSVVALLPGETGKKGMVEVTQMHGSSEMHPNTARIFWDGIAGWIEGGLKGGSYRVVEGLDVEGVNGALDGFRDGGFERVHVKIC